MQLVISEHEVSSICATGHEKEETFRDRSLRFGCPVSRAQGDSACRRSIRRTTRALGADLAIRAPTILTATVK